MSCKDRSIVIIATLITGAVVFFAAVGVSVTYRHYFDPPIVPIPWIEMSNNTHTEFCPVPVVEPFSDVKCSYSTTTAHLVCDCSETAPKLRPAFEDLLAFVKEHPKKGMTLIPPTLPGEASSRK